MKKFIKITCLFLLVIGCFTITSNNDHIEKAEASGTWTTIGNLQLGSQTPIYVNNATHIYRAVVDVRVSSLSFYADYHETVNIRILSDTKPMGVYYYPLYSLPDGTYIYSGSQGPEYVDIAIQAQARNQSPTINFTTTNNQVLSNVSGQNILQLNGSVTDSNVGDSILIKYSIKGLSGHQNKVLP
ncbi:hypothetical protein ACFSCX_06680 [Bacillus salitolerans]|uniref:Lipoprotein n=1 Tax=Bacillus salitolerans TaxID=1437434 RepID=A0ABW4LM79_9BACI